LSSHAREADAANLIHDYNIDITKNEEKAVDNTSSVHPTTAFDGGISHIPEGAAILIYSLGRRESK